MNSPESIAEEIVVDNVGYHIIQTSRDKLKGDITDALKARDEERDRALDLLDTLRKQWAEVSNTLRARAEKAELALSDGYDFKKMLGAIEAAQQGPLDVAQRLIRENAELRTRAEKAEAELERVKRYFEQASSELSNYASED